MAACSSLLLSSTGEAGLSSVPAALARRLAASLGRLLGRWTGHGAPIPPGNLEDEHSATAHMLRTPLTSIRSFSEIVLDNPDLPPEKRAEYLNIVVRESERLEKAIDAVLHEDQAA